MFFSVDVETSGLNPWTGELLTIGAVSVSQDGLIDLGNTYYERIDVELSSEWYEDDNDFPVSSTHEFWMAQDRLVRWEAYLDRGLLRLPHVAICGNLHDWVKDMAGNEEAFFVANPVSFDKMWIDWLFASPKNAAGIPNPFHYRSLCLRSMKYGLVSDPVYGSDRTNHGSEYPHHALYDAIAQAYDLINMLEMKKRNG